MSWVSDIEVAGGTDDGLDDDDDDSGWPSDDRSSLRTTSPLICDARDIIIGPSAPKENLNVISGVNRSVRLSKLMGTLPGYRGTVRCTHTGGNPRK